MDAMQRLSCTMRMISENLSALSAIPNFAVEAPVKVIKTEPSALLSVKTETVAKSTSKLFKPGLDDPDSDESDSDESESEIPEPKIWKVKHHEMITYWIPEHPHPIHLGYVKAETVHRLTGYETKSAAMEALSDGRIGPYRIVLETASLEDLSSRGNDVVCYKYMSAVAQT